MSNYAWVIDRDHLAETWGDPTNNVGVTGPRDAPADLLSRLGKLDPLAFREFQFRITDDDDIPYYTGRIAFAENGSPATADEEAVFGPLDDFGRPNDGATKIEYLTAGMWVAL